MALCANIVLSGGSTVFWGFAGRLQADVQRVVNAELHLNAEIASKKLGREVKPGKVPVKIIEHKHQQYAVWYGGAVLAMTGRAFYRQCLTKGEFDEIGPSIARNGSSITI
jgi:actin-related protein